MKSVLKYPALLGLCYVKIKNDGVYINLILKGVYLTILFQYEDILTWESFLCYMSLHIELVTVFSCMLA